MLYTLLDLLIVLQSGVHGDSPAGSPVATPVAGPGAPAAAPESAWMQFLPMMLLVGVFYFLLIRPQQKKQRELDAMLKALKKGQIVRTTGGVRGEITDLTDRDVTLLIADKVKINVLRSHVAGPEPDPAALTQKDAGSATAKLAEKGNA